MKQRNFHDYPILRMNEMPAVEVHIVETTDKMGGVGEPGVPPVAPALANAIFAATGNRTPASADPPRRLQEILSVATSPDPSRRSVTAGSPDMRSPTKRRGRSPRTRLATLAAIVAALAVGASSLRGQSRPEGVRT